MSNEGAVEPQVGETSAVRTQDLSDTQDDCEARIQTDLFNVMNISMRVFQQDDVELNVVETLDNNCGQVLEEAFKAFMRLQLVRKRACSLNNAMVLMRDLKGDLSSIFNWIDIRSDTFNSENLDKKKAKELHGTLFTSINTTSKNASTLPDTILAVRLQTLESSIGSITDAAGKGEGKTLFMSILKELTYTKWTNHSIILRSYNPEIQRDAQFLRRLKSFARELDGISGNQEILNKRLLVFRYSLETLIDTDHPDLFVRTLLHRHVPVAKARMERVLCEIKSRSRTWNVARLLKEALCQCEERQRRNSTEGCGGECQTAYCCFYNFSERHPFRASKDDHTYCFAHLYPHLGKLERLSKEMKVRKRGHKQFECIANMVLNILVRKRFGDGDLLYHGLSEILGTELNNSSFSLGYLLPRIHEEFYLLPEENDGHGVGSRAPPNPLKVYDHALVCYLFCKSLQVGRLFQASTTFNYIISNTAPRYTIERIMLFNITGPGEGKSYANKVLTYQFSKVRGCIETLTSFTPQAFKYKQKRNSCVVIIDDAHITHEKNIKSADRESNVIPNTFKNLLDTSVLESDVVMRDPNSGKVETVKYQAIHNCGFVWNTNTMGFVSEAWADRCLIMESEFPECVKITRSTNQMQDIIEKHRMTEIAALCLYRQNLIQSATMIANSNLMQFGFRFDLARDACVTALYASHIVCKGATSKRVSFCINQLVFAEAMKLACDFVFDIWIPPWTEVPRFEAHPTLKSYMRQLNENRLQALNRLTFGKLCLETNAVYKLCAAACLPDICPRVLDVQGRFACKVLGFILTQIHEQNLKNTIKEGQLCISGIDRMSFSDLDMNEGNEVAHEMLVLCSTCRVPSRNQGARAKSYKLCTYRVATHQGEGQTRNKSRSCRKVGSVTIPLEAVYDMMAIYAQDSHKGFWSQMTDAVLHAYHSEDFEEANAFSRLASSDDTERPSHRVKFFLDFNDDPIRSLILEATVGVEPLNELVFERCMLGGEIFRCSAPLCYGGILEKVLGRNAPPDALDARHCTEARLGPSSTFHGPRLSVYSKEYAGVPVTNMSSFCETLTIYHQHKVILKESCNSRINIIELEQDWEWKDARDVLNQIYGPETRPFSIDILKRDYAGTMMVVKGESFSMRPEDSSALTNMIRTMKDSQGSLAMRLGGNNGTTHLPTAKAACHERIPKSRARKRPPEGEPRSYKSIRDREPEFGTQP